ncbi:hypothetical protein CN295_13065 [Bacillus cereus]|nr:hypothetical protein CN295_13065 [Bacillus cereus]
MAKRKIYPALYKLFSN